MSMYNSAASLSGPLCFLFFHFLFFLFLGSGPDRERSPVEWGDFPFVRSFVRPSVRSSVPPPRGPKSQPGRPQSQPASQASEPVSQGSEKASQRTLRKDAWTDRKSPHSTGLRPLLGPLRNSNKMTYKTLFHSKNWVKLHISLLFLNFQHFFFPHLRPNDI